MCESSSVLASTFTKLYVLAVCVLLRLEDNNQETKQGWLACPVCLRVVALLQLMMHDPACMHMHI